MRFIKKHYYWVIVAVVLIQLIVCGGTNNNLQSLFTIPVSEGLRISRSTFALLGSLKGITSVIGTFISGALLLKYGYRKPVIACLLLAMSGLLLMSGNGGIGMYATGMTILGLADGICITAGPARIVSVWFRKHQGTVMGLVTAATGLGGSLMCLLLSGVMENSGWQAAYMAAAICVAAVAVLLFITVRDRPQNMGLKPYGEGEGIKNKKHRRTDEHWIGYSEKQMYRTPVFYLMIVGTFLSYFCSVIPCGVLVPHLQASGLTVQQATAMQSTLMLVLAGVKFLLGILSDAVGSKKVFMFCLMANVGVLVLFTLVTGPGMALLAVLAYTITLPLTSVMIPLLSSALFGYQSQAKCLGVFLAMGSASGMLAPIAANAVFDSIGSYNPVFLVCAAVTAVLVVVYFVMYRLADRDKKRILAEHESQPATVDE
jgi:sugar phosphate permease